MRTVLCTDAGSPEADAVSWWSLARVTSRHGEHLSPTCVEQEAGSEGSAFVSALGEQLEPLAWAGVHRVDQVFVAGDDSRRQRVQPRVAQRAEQQAKLRGGGGRLGRLRQIWWTAASTEVVVFACTRTWEVRVKVQRSGGSRGGRFDRFCVGFLPHVSREVGTP